MTKHLMNKVGMAAVCMAAAGAAGSTPPKPDARAEQVAADKAAAEATEALKATNGGKGNSVVDPKYRDRMKGREPDWVAARIAQFATATREVKTKVTEGEGENAKTIEKVEKRPAGVDADALSNLMRINHLNPDPYIKSKNQGWEGRFRMTASNMLRTRAKQFHGLNLPTDKGGVAFVSAPKDFLASKNAGEKPSHNYTDGSKIAPPKPEKPAEEAKGADSKKTETASA